MSAAVAEAALEADANRSPAELVADALADAQLSERDRADLLALAADSDALWRYWARPSQTEPEGDSWNVWAYVGGRGSGKTRAGAEYMVERAEAYHQAIGEHRGALVGRTVADVRDTMVEGESGLVAAFERQGYRTEYQPSRRRVLVPALRTVFYTYSAEVPDLLRGPQHHSAWGDEVAAWSQKVDAQGNTAYTNLLFGLRLDAPGLVPRLIATTTPKPIPLVQEWFAGVAPCARPLGHDGKHGPRSLDGDPDGGPVCGWTDPSLVMTKASLADNIGHLSAEFVRFIVDRYRDSPLGAQEIFGRLLGAVEGALWDTAQLEACRVHAAPALARIIVAVDPPAKWDAECGIIVLGVEAKPVDPYRPRVFVLDDMSMRGRAEAWGAQVIRAYHKWGAGLMVAEDNQGGDMVRATVHLQDATIRYQPVTAKKSKWKRAEPVASAYRQRVRHVGYFADLESQQVTWTEDDDWSPDRMDALVHGVRHFLPSISAAPARSVSVADMQIPGM